MKTASLTLFLYFSIFAAWAYAGNSTLLTNYPSPSGSYNNLVLQNLQQSPSGLCSNLPNTSGTAVLYYDTSNKALEVCVPGSTTPVLVPYREACFNRFCSCTGSSTCTCAFTGSTVCPTGYTQATQSGSALVDKFETGTTAPGYWVNATTCCGTSSTVLPSS